MLFFQKFLLSRMAEQSTIQSCRSLKLVIKVELYFCYVDGSLNYIFIVYDQYIYGSKSNFICF